MKKTSGLALRVLDLSGAVGAYCSKLLADLGAEVLIAEPPSGDDLRRKPPFGAQDGRPAESLVFSAYQANKRSITLDWTRPEALPVLAALGSRCDVVIASPTARRPLVGFDRDTPCLAWATPDAVVAAITPFGLTGPWRELRMTPFLSFAMSGQMHWVGPAEGPPQAFPGRLAWDEAGIHAALGIIAALSVSDRVGGQLLDLSVHEIGAAKDFLLERYDVGRPGEWGRSVGVGYPPTGVWPCADGPLVVAAHQEHHWQAFLAMLDHPEELSDPAYADTQFRREAFDLLERLIAPLMARHRRLDLFKKGQERGLPCAPYNTPGEFVADIQPRERRIFATLDDGQRPPIVIPWRWCHASSDLLELRRPAPTLGEHNKQVYLDELGFSADELARWGAAGLV